MVKKIVAGIAGSAFVLAVAAATLNLYLGKEFNDEMPV